MCVLRTYTSEGTVPTWDYVLPKNPKLASPWTIQALTINRPDNSAATTYQSHRLCTSQTVRVFSGHGASCLGLNKSTGSCLMTVASFQSRATMQLFHIHLSFGVVSPLILLL